MEKTLEKLKKSVEEGNFYEAHQMYRSVYNRYSKQAKPEEARKMVEEGAKEFFKVGQVGSGIDLAILLVNSLKQDEVKVNSDICNLVLFLFRQMPANHPSRKDFIKQIIGWSAKFGAYSSGEPALHFAIAQTLVSEKAYFDSEKHLLFGCQPESPRLAAKMCIDKAGGKISEAVLNVTHFSLRYLALKRLQCARILLEEFTSSFAEMTPKESFEFQGIKVNAYPEQILSYIQLLLIACQTKDPRVFMAFRNSYQNQFAKIDGIDSLLDQIASGWFGIQTKQAGGMNLNNLLSSLLGGAGGN